MNNVVRVFVQHIGPVIPAQPWICAISLAAVRSCLWASRTPIPQSGPFPKGLRGRFDLPVKRESRPVSAVLTTCAPGSTVKNRYNLPDKSQRVIHGFQRVRGRDKCQNKRRRGQIQAPRIRGSILALSPCQDTNEREVVLRRIEPGQSSVIGPFKERYTASALRASGTSARICRAANKAGMVRVIA